MKNSTYTIYYDEEGDFLEITLGEPIECSADEIEKGIFVRRNNIGEIKSIGILSFKKRAIALNEILKRFKLILPVEINF